jgi:aspartate aminotransferase
MTLKIANHIAAIPASPTLSLSARVKALQAEGKDIIDLSAGEPDFPLPQPFAEGIINALKAGHTTYPPVMGISKLREAVANDLYKRHDLSFTSDNILISTGAKQPLALIFQALLNPNDRVILPTPFWVSYADQIRLCHAEPEFVTCTAEDHYKLTPTRLEQALQKNARAVLFCSPSNPSGAVYTRDEWQALAHILRNTPDTAIILDQIYDQLVYDGQKSVSLLTVAPDLVDRTIIIDGVSKAYAATGLRLGWAAGPKEIIKAMGNIQGHTTSGACAIIQHGAYAMLQSLERETILQEMLTAYQRRRNNFIHDLQSVSALKVFKPEGAFYLWCDISGLLKPSRLDDKDFAAQLLQEQGVAVVPGSAFGAPHHIRMHIATSDAILKSAANKIAVFCGG